MYEKYEHYDFLKVEVKDHIATVTLNKPERANTFDAAAHREMAEIWNPLADDDDVHTVVIAAEGEFFCGGPAPEFLQALTNQAEPKVRDRAFKEVWQTMNRGIDFDKPVITALSGVAHGGGLAFALLADIIIIEEHVTIQEGHIFVGVTAGDGGTIFWPAAMSLTKAKRYLLTSDPISAEEANQLGLVTEVVSKGKSFERAMEYARRFAKGPQPALRSTKRALNQYLRHGMLTAFPGAWAQEIYTMSTADIQGAAEGVARGDMGLMPADPAVAAKPKTPALDF